MRAENTDDTDNKVKLEKMEIAQMETEAEKWINDNISAETQELY